MKVFEVRKNFFGDLCYSILSSHDCRSVDQSNSSRAEFDGKCRVF